MHRFKLAGLLLGLLLGLLSATTAAPPPAAATEPNPHFKDALWVAESEQALKLALADGTVLIEIPHTGKLDAFAVDEASGTLWAFGEGRLHAYSFAGKKRYTVVPPHNRDDIDGDDDGEEEDNDEVDGGEGGRALLKLNPNDGNIRTGESVTVKAGADGSFSAELPGQSGDTFQIRITDLAGNTSEWRPLAIGNGATIPPDPATIAPPLSSTGITPMGEAIAFLYNGADPIQIGVSEGTIEPSRVAVIRGKVLDREDQPLPGVSLTIKDHPEYGQTVSRQDGMFDLAVNGGGQLTLNYQRPGFLPVQRTVQTPWQDFALADDVVMIPLDGQVTTVDLASSSLIQVARSSPSTDADGSRQATVLFPQGTQATMTLPDDTTPRVSPRSMCAPPSTR